MTKKTKVTRFTKLKTWNRVHILVFIHDFLKGLSTFVENTVPFWKDHNITSNKSFSPCTQISIANA